MKTCEVLDSMEAKIDRLGLFMYAAGTVIGTAKAAKIMLCDRLPHGDRAHRDWLAAELAFCFAPMDRAIAEIERLVDQGVISDRDAEGDQ
jgi:hypothetical protein